MQKSKPLWGGLLFVMLLTISTPAEKLNLASADSSRTTLRSPTGALFRSVAIPGWGQFYNKKYLKAALVFLGEGSLIAGAVVEWKRMDEHKKIFEALPDTNPQLKTSEFNQYQYHKDNRNLFLWWTAGVIFISMWDAYADAQLSSFEKEEKQEPRWGLVPETDLSHKEIKINLSFRF